MAGAVSPAGKRRRWLAPAAACACVLAVLAALAGSIGSRMEWTSDPAESAYNLLVRGFRAGRLSLDRAVPEGLARLADPYDPVANQPYRQFPYGLHDLSYHRGRLYLYFGPAPAVVLFWPWKAVTGRYLSHRAAAVLFCGAGFLALAGILLGAARRHFPGSPPGVTAACCAALGLAGGIPVLLQWTNVYEVAIACGHAMAMLSLACVALAGARPARAAWWLAAASFLYGLAVAARPSLLPGAAMLAIPLLPRLRADGSGPPWRLAVAASAPLLVIGTGLMAYNAGRFGDPFEFGQRYQLLVGRGAGSGPSFNLRYLPFNLRLYFLEAPRFQAAFPFLRDAVAGRVPAGHGLVESPFGILACVPLAWLALAAPLGCRGREPGERRALAALLAAAGVLFATGAVTVGAFWWTAARYEADFLPPLLLLAVLGILAIERALAAQPRRRALARAAWLLLAAVSVAFNLLAGVRHRADQYFEHGKMMLALGRPAEATSDFSRALEIRPDTPDFLLELASARRQAGMADEGIRELREFAARNPGSAEAEERLGVALRDSGRPAEAIPCFERALALRPGYDDAEAGLGFALAAAGRDAEAAIAMERALSIRSALGERPGGGGLVHSYEDGEMLLALRRYPDAVAAFSQALRIKPDYGEARRGLAEAENGLASGLAAGGRAGDAAAHLEEALRLRPDFAEAHSNLGLVLAGMGRGAEAIAHFKEALRLSPGLAGVRCNLGFVLARGGRLDEAAAELDEDLRADPGDALAHTVLGVVLAKKGRLPEAAAHLRRALELQPGLREAQDALARLPIRQAQGPTRSTGSGQALRQPQGGTP
jgi:tetratricopeptide (TPR) repeat protein